VVKSKIFVKSPCVVVCMALSCPALSDFLPTPSSSFRGWFMSGEMTGLMGEIKKEGMEE
jgi:hypothetical protein